MKNGGDRFEKSERVRATSSHPDAAHRAASTRSTPARSADPVASPVATYVADEVAFLALSARHAEAAARGEGEVTPCDACGEPIQGEPAGRGLYFWSRDGVPRLEEPGLCEGCAVAILGASSRRYEIEEEEG